MAWIKRNLFFVIGGLIALGLMGLAGFFLYTKMQSNQAVTEELDKSTRELDRLVKRDPHPGSDQMNNIGAAKVEAKKLEAFVGDLKRFFPVAPYTKTNQITSREFRAKLDTTVHELQRNAEIAGVKLPDDYWFTFDAQKKAMTFAPGVVEGLATQLDEIKSICEILFDAKVIKLTSMRRVPVATEDTGFEDFLSDRKAVTNEFSIVTPYEVTFQGFSSELAHFLEGIVKSTNCFVVKNVATDDAQSEAPTSPDSTIPYDRYSGGEQRGPVNPYARYGGAMGGMRPGMMSPEMARRYGFGAPLAPTPASTRPSRPGVLVDEKPLRITISVDAVKLKPKPAK